jgi:hypothetical protein
LGILGGPEEVPKKLMVSVKGLGAAVFLVV